MKSQRENLERERRLNEALTAKLTDLEANGARRESEVAELKRFLQTVKEEHQQLIQVSLSRPFQHVPLGFCSSRDRDPRDVVAVRLDSISFLFFFGVFCFLFFFRAR